MESMILLSSCNMPSAWVMLPIILAIAALIVGTIAFCERCNGVALLCAILLVSCIGIGFDERIIPYYTEHRIVFDTTLDYEALSECNVIWGIDGRILKLTSKARVYGDDPLPLVYNIGGQAYE